MKTLLANVAISLVSLALALLAGEAALRAAGYQAGNPLERLINHPDPYLGYRMVPGMHETVAGPGGAYTVDTIDVGVDGADDGAAFRDDGVTRPVGSVFIGDSFVWGFGVELAESISERYEALSGSDAVNLGMTSWTSPTQYARVLERYGVPLAPRFAFMEALVENDFGDGPNFADWLASGSTKAYPVWMTERVMHYEPDSLTYRLRRALYDRSALARLVSDRVQFGIRDPDPAGEAAEHVTAGGLDLWLDPREIATGEPDAREVAIFRDALAASRRTAEAHGIELVVFLVPTKELVYQDRFAGAALRAAQDWRYETLKRLLDESGIAHVDLLPALRAASAKPGPQLYFARDTHWTPAGHIVAAVALREFVVRHCLSRGCTP